MPTTDFGWRWHGRTTTVLVDRSFDLSAPVGGDGAWGRRRGREMAGLESCLQCGTCTATCDLSGGTGMFPRRQLTFVRLGLSERAACGPEIWQCYGCTDCTATCPSGAQPAEVMAALRELATERFACPRRLAHLVNDPKILLGRLPRRGRLPGRAGGAGRFLPPRPGPIAYAGMLPDDILVPVFSALTAIILAVAVIGVVRAWRAWYGGAPGWGKDMAPATAAAAGRRGRARRAGRAWRAALPEVAAQKRLSQCDAGRLRPWAHRALVAGFAGLALASGFMALTLVLGRPYPLPMASPAKVLSNLFAALLVAGTSYFLVVRARRAGHGQHSDFFDWALLVNLLLAGLTGVATELVRVAGARGAAYPVYFAHLVVVLVLMSTLPYSKLAHVLYRVVAIAGREYGAAGEPPGSAPPPDRAIRPTGAAPATRAPSPEELLAMAQAELSGYPDEIIEQAYYELRDRAEPRAGGRYYPNIKRLFGTALEREKDRREIAALVRWTGTSGPQPGRPEVGGGEPGWQSWYEDAVDRPCTWWVENHIGARHALTTCMNCGMCTSVCPAAEHFEEYDPRCIVDVALSGDEDRLVALLKSDIIWYCAQCGSCNSRCPHSNDIMGLVGSLRCLAQLKGYHVESVRGRQQYAGRHLWGGNLWNRAMSLYFRNGAAADHPDFGPAYADWQARAEDEFARVGGQPDMDGTFAGRKVAPETLAELRACVRSGGAAFLWDRIERHGAADAARRGLDLDQYYDKVRTEG